MFYPFEKRVDQLISKLTQNETNLGLMYFEEPDYTGHKFGPDSPEMDKKLIELDNLIGYFVEQMKDKNLFNSTNIIITSDHGMATVELEKFVPISKDIQRLIDFKKSTFNRMSGLIYPKSTKLYSKLKSLQRDYPMLKVWKKSEIPRYLHYTNHYRIPSILITVKMPYSLKLDRVRVKKGDHGWMSESSSSPSDMYPFFLARGPNITKSESLISPFENVSVYPLCCKLLHLHPAPNNGSLEGLSPFILT